MGYPYFWKHPYEEREVLIRIPSKNHEFQASGGSARHFGVRIFFRYLASGSPLFFGKFAPMFWTVSTLPPKKNTKHSEAFSWPLTEARTSKETISSPHNVSSCLTNAMNSRHHTWFSAAFHTAHPQQKKGKPNTTWEMKKMWWFRVYSGFYYPAEFVFRGSHGDHEKKISVGDRRGNFLGQVAVDRRAKRPHYWLPGDEDVWRLKRRLWWWKDPGRLTWNLQITHLERKMIFQTSMIMFHVNFPGCTPPKTNIEPENTLFGKGETSINPNRRFVG